MAIQTVAAPINQWLLWANGVWALICVVLGTLLWRSKSTSHKQEAPDKPRESTEDEDFRGLERALEKGDLQRIRHALHLWAKRCHRQALIPEPSLTGLCKKADRQTVEQIQGIDRALYAKSPEKSLDSRQLKVALHGLRLELKRQRDEQKASALKPLYPSKS